MKRRLNVLLVLFAGALMSCATPQVGITVEEFKQNCWNASWENATEFQLRSGDIVVMCPVSGAVKKPQYQLFEGGVLERILHKAEVVALLEDDRCQSFGVQPGTSGYVNCRIGFAQLRAQVELDEAQRRQQSAQFLMAYSLAIMSMQQPVNVNVRANCTATQTGAFTSYTCR